MQTEPPKTLQAFQQAYSQYLRNPEHSPLPIGIPLQRSRVYETLVFNNVRAFIDKCFPVARSLVDSKIWYTLSRNFYAHGDCHTPIFSHIPEEFARFIASRPAAIAEQPWLAELLHYEWLELKVELHEASVSQAPTAELDAQTLLTVNPTLMVQAYQWPVHRIDATHIPRNPQPALLCVYRNAQLQVKFMEINSVTAELLQLLRDQPQTAQSVLAELACRLPQLSSAQIQHFGIELIEQFMQNNLLLTDITSA